MQRNDNSDPALSPPARRAIDFHVHSGEHTRRGCPVYIELPGVVERPEVFREGRQRPVPCQVEPVEGQSRLWWVIEGQAASATVAYRVELGVRQRLAPPRVAIEQAAAGWTATVRDIKAAELHFADAGSPRIGLYSGLRPIAVISHEPLARTDMDPDASNPPIDRRRVAKPTLVDGPVFGGLAAEYLYADRRGVPLWTESQRVRIYDGPEDLTLVDLAIDWHATTGPIRLSFPTSAGFGGTAGGAWTPTLRVDLAALGSFELVTLPGWRGEEIATRPAPALVAMSRETCLAVFCRSTSFGFPPRWSRSGAAVEASPSGMGWQAGPPDDPVMRSTDLPLGATLAVHYRFAVMRARDLVGEATARYFDFDAPPCVRLVS